MTTIGARRASWIGLLVLPLLVSAGCSSAAPTAAPTVTSPSASTSRSTVPTPVMSSASAASPSPVESTSADPAATPSAGCPEEPTRRPRPVRTPAGGLSSKVDGTVALIGPTLIAKGLDNQVLIADVTNVGDTGATWRVELDLPLGEANDTIAVVSAGRTTRVQIPIDVERTGQAVATASLVDADGLLSRSELNVNSVDLSDCAQ